MSDDDRMSLTTAISDDDEIDDNMQNSSYRAKQSAMAASFNCTGAVRKAGFLSVKKWILRKKHQVRVESKQLKLERVLELIKIEVITTINLYDLFVMHRSS